MYRKLSLIYGEDVAGEPYLDIKTDDRDIVITTGTFASARKDIERINRDPRTTEAWDELNLLSLAGVMDIREWLGVSLEIMGVN